MDGASQNFAELCDVGHISGAADCRHMLHDVRVCRSIARIIAQVISLKAKRHMTPPPHPILRQVRQVQATTKYATAMPSAAQLRLPQAQVRP